MLIVSMFINNQCDYCCFHGTFYHCAGTHLPLLALRKLGVETHTPRVWQGAEAQTVALFADFRSGFTSVFAIFNGHMVGFRDSTEGFPHVGIT